MKMKIEKGILQIDVHELVEQLDAKTRNDLCRYLVADERLMANVLEVVITGEYNADDEDGAWWFGSEDTARLREKLIPLMGEVAQKLVRELICQRDAAKKDAERHRKWAWAMYHVWPEHIARRPEMPDFETTSYPSDATVEAVMAEEVAP